MKYYIKTDEKNKIQMIMPDRHPMIEDLIEIEMPEEEYAAISSSLNRYMLEQNGEVNTLIYTNPTEEETAITFTEEKEAALNSLRNQRERDCFSVINRGQLWYSMLTFEQLSELNSWYQAWLSVTETICVPIKPEWLI